MTDGTTQGRDRTPAADHLIGHITTFVRELRAQGVDVPANAGIDAARAIETTGLGDRVKVQAALRATLVSRRQDIETFDRLFPSFWERLLEDFEEPRDIQGFDLPGEDTAPPGGERTAASNDSTGSGEDGTETGVTDPGDADDEGPKEPESSDPADATGSQSDSDGEDEIGFAVDTSTYSRVGQPEPITVEAVGEDDSLTESIDELTWAICNLKGRRWEATARGNRIDARRALRRSFSAGGTVPDIPWRQQQRSDVLAVIIVDVSQSVLDTIDRGFLLRFLRELYDAWRDVRIFFFDTHVREVTEAFAVPSTQGALLALERAEAEWGGGTRIGHAFETVRTEHPYAIDRESTVFVISDGLEVDEIDRLEAEMAQVSRKSNAVFWLNPLATSTEYEPTCRGMAASLPYIDGLFPLSNESDVEEIARQLRLRGMGGSIGYQYDRRDRAAPASRQ